MFCREPESREFHGCQSSCSSYGRDPRSSVDDMFRISCLVSFGILVEASLTSWFLRIVSKPRSVESAVRLNPAPPTRLES